MAPSRLPFSDIGNKPRCSSVAGVNKPVPIAASVNKPFPMAVPFKKPKDCNTKISGPWTKHEHLAFLHGLRMYGSGQWKKICKLIPTRDNIQVKSHGQQQMKKYNIGINIFADLDRYFQEQEREVQRRSVPSRMVNIHPNQARSRVTYPRPFFGSFQIRPLQQIRLPTEVIDAACTLVVFSSAPRIFNRFNQAKNYRGRTKA